MGNYGSVSCRDGFYGEQHDPTGCLWKAGRGRNPEPGRSQCLDDSLSFHLGRTSSRGDRRDSCVSCTLGRVSVVRAVVHKTAILSDLPSLILFSLRSSCRHFGIDTRRGEIHSKMKLFFAIISFFLVSTSLSAGSVDQKKKDLKQFQQKIVEQKSRLQLTLEKEGSLHKELKKMNEAMEGLNQNIASLEGGTLALRRKISNTEEEISILEAQISDNQFDLGHHFRNLYKHRVIHPIRVLLNSESLSDMRKEQYYAKRWMDV